MSSLFDIGRSGLQSYRRALSVTGQNIANVNTDGYKRREAELQEVSAGKGDIYSVSSNSGLGVRVSDIKRSFDEFLPEQGAQCRRQRRNVLSLSKRPAAASEHSCAR